MIVIYNPTAGRGRHNFMEQVLTIIRTAGETVELRPTSCAGDAERIAKELSPEDDSMVVAAGGDGTISEVANGLLHNSHAEAFSLGILPMGTANVLAHEIGLSSDPSEIASTLLHGKTIPFHSGCMSFSDTDKHNFLIMAGAGFDAQVVAAVSPSFKKIFGKASYILHTLRLAIAGKFPLLSVTIDGEIHTARNVVICNGKHYGGPYTLAPNANISTSDFEVVLLPKAGGLHTLKQGLQLILGTLGRSKGAETITAKTITISGHDGAPLQADGDTIGTLPVTITTTFPRLKLLIPKNKDKSFKAAS